MSRSFCVELEREDEQLMRAAATWCANFYPDIHVIVGDASVELCSDALDSAGLERVWASALLNEALCWQNAEFRQNVLARLAQ